MNINSATDYNLNTKEAKDDLTRKIPLGFVGDVSDLDGILLYLSSNRVLPHIQPKLAMTYISL